MQLYKYQNLKNKILSSVFFALSFLFIGLAFMSCGSTKVEEHVVESPVEDFTYKTLSNGIPVIYKQNPGSKILVTRLIFEGGTSLIDKSLSGIEGMAFNLALRGSEKYDYKTISQLEYEKSFSLSAYSGKDYSTAGFVCIQRDMAQVMDIFSDCLLNPLFLEEDFNNEMTNASSSIAARKSDPNGSLAMELANTAFSDHPYSSFSYVTEESYPNINMTMIKGIHRGLLNALRIKILVVGNFNSSLIEDFTRSLEEKFGSLPRKAFSLPKIPKITVNIGSKLIANEQAGKSGYIAGLFECPSKSSEEYIPFALSLLYLDDLLFAQVREKAGAVYSINSGVIGGKELAGVISAYRVSGKKSFKKTLLDAIASFDANYLAENIEKYKNKYITSIFSSAQTATGIAGSVITSMEYLGSEKAYLSRADLVQAVEPRHVIAAYKNYIEPIAKQNAAAWIVVDSEDSLSEYDF
ncbi:MAG: insulinase family protein [Treponema sp.]|nr:insulinase family protein [Treponema sp.]